MPLAHGAPMYENDEGAPVILEVELTEPSLFLEHGGAESVVRAADAVVARL